MNQDEINKLQRLSLDLNTDLCILKNAIKNGDDNDLHVSDLANSIENLYTMSDKIRKIVVEL